MIRIVYRWRVPPENFLAFREAWTSATNAIHDEVPGALGSFMLRESEAPDTVLTIARWESRKHWEAFWGEADPEAMVHMRRLGERLAADVYDEIDDFTRPAGNGDRRMAGPRGTA